MNSKKRVIVNFASIGRDNYPLGSLRLIESIKKHNLNCDVYVFSPDMESKTEQFGEDTINIVHGMPDTEKYGKCKSHSEQKYLFKLFSIQKMVELGYEKILWCDSSIVINTDIEHLWKLLDQQGIILFDNPGCLLDFYTSKSCFDQMGYSMEEGNHHFQCDAGIMMFDMTNNDLPNTKKIFEDYGMYCMDGICLNGIDNVGSKNYKAHRHDQSIMSILAQKHHINYLNYGVWNYGWDPRATKSTFTKTKI